ncbi:MAG: hypothetical protein O3A02_04255, partial [bacterium]|nr:hypothetical protein [bacterium]
MRSLPERLSQPNRRRPLRRGGTQTNQAPAATTAMPNTIALPNPGGAAPTRAKSAPSALVATAWSRAWPSGTVDDQGERLRIERA